MKPSDLLSALLTPAGEPQLPHAAYVGLQALLDAVPIALMEFRLTGGHLVLLTANAAARRMPGLGGVREPGAGSHFRRDGPDVILHPFVLEPAGGRQGVDHPLGGWLCALGVQVQENPVQSRVARAVEILRGEGRREEVQLIREQQGRPEDMLFHLDRGRDLTGHGAPPGKMKSGWRLEDCSGRGAPFFRRCSHVRQAAFQSFIGLGPTFQPLDV